MAVKYSKKMLGFYDPADEQARRDLGLWPDDLVDVDAADYCRLFEEQSNGKIIQPDENGYPIAVDPAQPTAEQLIEIAINKRDELLAVATRAIAPLQDALDLDDATPAEIALLKKWKQYRIAVNRVTTQPDFPRMIEWPDAPA